METLARERKWLLLSSGVVALAMLIIASYVILTVCDGPAPDDSAMTPEWPTVPQGKQPLSDFLDAARQSNVIGIESKAEDNPLSGIDPPSPVFAALDTLLASDPKTWAWRDGSKQEKMLQADLDALDHLEATKLVLMRHARHGGATGQIMQAVQDCLKLIRLGHGLAQTRTTAMRLSTAVKFQQHGIAMLEHFITHSSVTPAQLKETLMTLQMLPGPSQETCRFACRVQYQNLKHLLHDPATQDAVLKELERFPPWRNEIKVNQTLSGWISDFTPSYDALARDWPATVAALRASALSPAKLTTWDRQVVKLRRNRAGSIYGRMMSPLFMLRHVVEFKTVHSQATLMLALRLYELEKGQLPDNLDQLAPHLLHEVPADPYTTHAFRWSPANRLLYSVGMDATDNGGNPYLHADILSPRKPPVQQTSDDLGQYYWWSSEAQDHRSIALHQMNAPARP